MIIHSDAESVKDRYFYLFCVRGVNVYNTG
ncbi:uncharacterized protein METZ01_LOCUS326955, partial [marine metagenome]